MQRLPHYQGYPFLAENNMGIPPRQHQTQKWLMHCGIQRCGEHFLIFRLSIYSGKFSRAERSP